MAAGTRCAHVQLGRVPPVDFVVRLTAVNYGPRIALSPRSKRLARLPDAMSALRSGGKLAQTSRHHFQPITARQYNRSIAHHKSVGRNMV
jgi:phospholipid N-methyltransferase